MLFVWCIPFYLLSVIFSRLWKRKNPENFLSLFCFYCSVRRNRHFAGQNGWLFATWNKISKNMEERSTSVYVNQQIAFRMSQMTEYTESEKSPTALDKISLVLISITVKNWQILQQGSWYINSSELKHEFFNIQTGICKSFSKRKWFPAVLILNQAMPVDCDFFYFHQGDQLMLKQKDTCAVQMM